jgi:hypothetical protein
MSVKLSESWGFNSGFGMQTTNVEAGTETIFHTTLGSPVTKAGVQGVGLANGDCALLFRTKTCNRISRLEFLNGSNEDLTFSMFFAFFKDGKLAFPVYKDGNIATSSLAVGAKDDLSGILGLESKKNTARDIWWGEKLGDTNGLGSAFAFRGRLNDNFKPGLIFSPQLEPNIGAIMDKSLRGDPANAEVGADNGLKNMGIADTDVAICLFCGTDLTEAQCKGIVVKMAVIETDISARNETESYVRSWNQIPAGGIHAGNGLVLPYDPKDA